VIYASRISPSLTQLPRAGVLGILGKGFLKMKSFIITKFIEGQLTISEPFTAVLTVNQFSDGLLFVF